MDLEAEFMKPDGGPAFEQLMLKVCGKLYHTTFALFGRSGQIQYGIDLYTSGFRICVQCKNYSDHGALMAVMEKDFHSAIARFGDKMEEYVLATTLQRDVKTQELADNLWYSLPPEQRAHTKFTVLFWDEIFKCLKENRDFLANDSIFLPSEYDRVCPDPEVQLWWMGTSKKQGRTLIKKTPGSADIIKTRRLSIRPLCNRSAEPNMEQNRDPEWIDQLEAMPEYYSEVQWLDDLRPVCLGPLFLCTQGRGIFFLISDWHHGLTDSLNRYAASILDDAPSFEDKGFGWVEIKPEDYRYLCDQHSGTVIGIDESWDDVQKLIKCVQQWKDLGQKGQLIFHIYGELSSYEQWAELEHRATHYIQKLRSIFGSLPISLMTAYHPFLHSELLNPSETPLEFPEEERPVDWIRRNPERLPDVFCGFSEDPHELFQWLPALSGWPDVVETIFASMEVMDDVQYLLDELNLNYEMCALALYRLYREDPSWMPFLQDCVMRCGGRVERTFQYLLDPNESQPEDLDDVLYTLLCQEPADFLGEEGRIMQLLNGQRSLMEVAQSSNGRELLKQLGSILLPESDQYTDELIGHFRGLIRPYI